MNNSILVRLFSFMLVSSLILPSSLASAQATTTSGRDDSIEPLAVREYWIRESRGRSSEMTQKIFTLDQMATSTIAIPVLFGVRLVNIFPNFGDPRSGGARTHEGEDIMGVLGTPVVSPTPAIVLRTGVGAGEGNYVYTANPGGETFVYMHLDRIGEGIASGAELQAGSLIGYLGDTGNAKGGAAHLHFEIRKNGATDPYPRLKLEFTQDEQMSYLAQILTQSSSSTVLAEFMVKNFRTAFISIGPNGIKIPPPITAVLMTLPPATVTGSITLNLYKGINHPQVRTLQQLLNSKGFIVASSGGGSAGYETNFFGSATKAAVIKFQKAKGIVPAVGYVGPLTRAALL